MGEHNPASIAVSHGVIAMTNKGPTDDSPANDQASPGAMSSKEKLETLIGFLQTVVSWPFMLLIIIFLLRERLPLMADRITSIGPSGIEMQVAELTANQATTTANQATTTANQATTTANQETVQATQETIQATQETLQATGRQIQAEVSQVAATQVTIDKEVARIRESLGCQMQGRAQVTPVGSGEEPRESVAGLPPEREAELRAELAEFAAYLTGIGFSLPAEPVGIGVMPNVPQTVWYDPLQRLICIGSARVNEPNIALRQFAHDALFSVAEDRADWSPRTSSIESGLAFYYPASFTNDSALAESELGKSLKIDVATPTIRRTLDAEQGVAWGAAFWELRGLLGQERADRALHNAWVGQARSGPEQQEPDDFVQQILSALAADGGPDESEQVREIFADRGVSVPE